MTELDESDLCRIFEEEVIPRLLVTDPQPQDRPQLVVVGGQPGAGKSTAMTFFAEQLTDQGGLVVVSMDDYRPFHPDYAHLLEHDDTAMAAATRPAAYRWQTMAADWLRANHYNVALEAGFRDPGAVMGTVEGYSAAGYRVQVVALAVPSGVSRVGIIQRYANQREVAGAGRWTTRQSHDSDYVGSIEVLRRAEASSSVERILLLDRNGVIYDQRPGAGDPSAVNALLAARNAPQDTSPVRRDLATALARLEALGARTAPVQEMAQLARTELGHIHRSHIAIGVHRTAEPTKWSGPSPGPTKSRTDHAPESGGRPRPSGPARGPTPKR